jgi:hypothetical protein
MIELHLLAFYQKQIQLDRQPVPVLVVVFPKAFFECGLHRFNSESLRSHSQIIASDKIYR